MAYSAIDNIYYVYLHIKETTGEPFYVGKGCGGRANDKRRNNFWKNIVKKHGYDILFLEENLTEEESLKRESYWIERIGRRDLDLGTLVNMTDGGDGGETGRVFTDKHKANMSKAKRGIRSNPDGEFKDGNIPWNKDMKMDENWIDNLGHNKKVIDTNSGHIFKSVSKAAEHLNMKRTTLIAQLKGQNKNKTTLKYYNHV